MAAEARTNATVSELPDPEWLKLSGYVEDQPSRTKKGKLRKPRPTIYTEAIGSKICARLAAGETLVAICKPAGMPSEAVVRYWAWKPNHPFGPLYRDARMIGYLRMSDEITNISDGIDEVTGEKRKGAGTNEEIRRDALRVSARQWVAARMLPKVFGDRITLKDDDSGATIRIQIMD